MRVSPTIKIATFLVILIQYCGVKNVCASRVKNTKTRQNQNRRENIEKIDLAIIIDESEDMQTKDLRLAIKLVFKLVKHFSISPGTTRVALYTVGAEFKKHFEFRDNVNREGLMQNIKKLVLKTSPRNKNFTENIRTGFEEIKSKHTDIEGQRHIYLYVTNKHDDVKQLGSELELHSADEVNVLLVGKIQNGGKENRHKKNTKNVASVVISKYLSLPTTTIAQQTKNKQPVVMNPVRRGNIEMAGKSKIKTIDVPSKTEHILYMINVENKIYGKCTKRKEGRAIQDECNRHCTCENSKLTNCYRLRKEFTSMSSEERRRYLRAYKTLTTQSPYKETYERFIFMHYKYFCWGIHSGDLFLPWHRWFLSIMEDLLRQIDCGVTIPYWDWSYVSRDPWNRTNLWRTTEDGLGKFLLLFQINSRQCLRK